MPVKVRSKLRRRLTRWAFALAAGGLAAAIIFSLVASSIFTTGGSQSTDSGSGASVGESHPITDSEHLQRDVSFTGYSTTPPTSGRHWSQRNPDAPIACGIYDEELRDEQVTHNLEHGVIVISYNLSDSQMISELKDAAKDLPSYNRWLVMRPYSKIPEGEIAMTAWGWLQRFDEVDPEEMKEFYEAHFGNGPEFINC